METLRPLVEPSAIEAWTRDNVRPSAVERRAGHESEALLRRALCDGMADLLFADENGHGIGKPNWKACLPRLAAAGRGAGDLGFGAALTVQNLVTGLHLGAQFKMPAAEQVYAAARGGSAVVSFAATEPDTGAHPGKMRTVAERTPNGWRLSGVKTFSSNGWIADHVVVIAVSGEANGRRRFVALVVPSSAKGITREALTMPICPTMSHATLRFHDVELSDDLRVGEEGEAYLKLVRPFRAYEDLANAALMLGHLQGMEKDAAHMPAEARGRLRALLSGLDVLVAVAGAALDTGGRHDALRLSLPYLLEPAIRLVIEHPHEEPLWQARSMDLGIATLGANVRRKFYEKLGA